MKTNKNKLRFMTKKLFLLSLIILYTNDVFTMPPPAITPTPGMPTPGMPTPGMPTPGMPTPGMPTPGMTTPGMPTPGMPTPGMPTPGMSTPGMSTPPPPPPSIPQPQIPITTPSTDAASTINAIFPNKIRIQNLSNKEAIIKEFTTTCQTVSKDSGKTSEISTKTSTQGSKKWIIKPKKSIIPSLALSVSSTNLSSTPLAWISKIKIDKDKISIKKPSLQADQNICITRKNKHWVQVDCAPKKIKKAAATTTTTTTQNGTTAALSDATTTTTATAPDEAATPPTITTATSLNGTTATTTTT